MEKTDRTVLRHMIQSFFSTWALMKAARMEPGNILTFVFFLLVFFFYRHVHRRRELMLGTGRIVVSGTAVLFTLLYMLVDYPHYIELLTSRLYRAVILGIVFTGFVFLFYHLLLFLFSYTCNKSALRTLLLCDYAPACYVHPDYPRLSAGFTKVFSFYKYHTALSSFLLCLLGWLPYYLYQYPGIMTPDSINQFEQVLGLVPYSNHHPWVHTMLFGLFYHIGYTLTKDMVTAVSFYTLFQMCLLSGSIAYFISTLRSFRIRPFVLLLITAFYALIPYHAVFSVTIWKDIPFAAAVLFFGCALLRLSLKGKINAANLTIFLYQVL